MSIVPCTSIDMNLVVDANLGVDERGMMKNLKDPKSGLLVSLNLCCVSLCFVMCVIVIYIIREHLR